MADSKTLQTLCHIATPVGMLGYGFDSDELVQGLECLQSSSVPVAIILDSGSTDSGPQKLALGSMTCPRSAYKDDLRKLVAASVFFKVPVIIGSAGGDGTNCHVNGILHVVEEILEERVNTPQLKTVVVYSEVSKALARQRLDTGHIQGCGSCVPDLTDEAIEASTVIVGQMGPEPLLDAMVANADFDIFIAGRCYDPSPYVAYCAFVALRGTSMRFTSLGDDILGGFTHMGKIMECGGLCAVPKTRGAISTLYENGVFDVVPLSSTSRCTPQSVAAHTFYEKSQPDILHGPGGHLDLTQSSYEQLVDARSVRVSGSKFHFSRVSGHQYTLKLEAAKLTGWRTIFMGSFRDLILISQLDEVLVLVKEYVRISHRHINEQWDLDFHVYGRPPDGKTLAGTEIMIVGEAKAESQIIATSIASAARIACVHGSYPGQKATSGNFAMGIGGPLVIETGQCSEFSVYHLMDLFEGEERAKPRKGVYAIDEERETAESIFEWEAKYIGARKAKNGVMREQGCGDPSPPPVRATRDKRTEVKNEKHGIINGLADPTAEVLKGRLGQVASIVRSKNSGPFEITFDVFFSDDSTYHKVKAAGILDSRKISELYNVSEEEVIWCGFFDQALGFKATIPRKKNGRNAAAGGFMEGDIHASTQHMPLMLLPLPESLLQELGLGSTSGTF